VRERAAGPAPRPHHQPGAVEAARIGAAPAVGHALHAHGRGHGTRGACGGGRRGGRAAATGRAATGRAAPGGFAPGVAAGRAGLLGGSLRRRIDLGLAGGGLGGALLLDEAGDLGVDLALELLLLVDGLLGVGGGLLDLVDEVGGSLTVLLQLGDAIVDVLLGGRQLVDELGAVAGDGVDVAEAHGHLALVPAVHRDREGRVVRTLEVGVDGVVLQLGAGLVALGDRGGEPGLGLADALLHLGEL